MESRQGERRVSHMTCVHPDEQGSEPCTWLRLFRAEDLCPPSGEPGMGRRQRRAQRCVLSSFCTKSRQAEKPGS